VTHGLTGDSLTIPGESEAEMIAYLNAIVEDLYPLGAAEEALALDVAQISWRLRRAPRAEAGLFQQWLLVDQQRRLEEDKRSRPKLTPEIMKKHGIKLPSELPEEERLALQKKANEQWEQRKNAELGEAISIDASGPNALLKLARYETALSRRRERSLAALMALQRERQSEIPRELSA
jgi:hypothetical protein